MKLTRKLVLAFGIAAALFAGCKPVPVTPGSYSFANWPSNRTGRLKFEGQVYDSNYNLLRSPLYANVPVNKKGEFSYSLSSPAPSDLSTIIKNEITSTCKVSNTSVKTISGFPIANYDGSTTRINVLVATKAPTESPRSAREIYAAVYPSSDLTVTGTCKQGDGKLVKTDIKWKANKWNYFGRDYDANGVVTVRGFEKLGDPDFAAYLMTNQSGLSTQTIGGKAKVRPLAFIR